MRVNSEHHETATACVADFFSKLTQGQIDPGALTAALFNKAIIEMMRMDGADAVHKALRVYADQFDDRKPNDGTNDNGSRLAESLPTAGYHPELVVQFLLKFLEGRVPFSRRTCAFCPRKPFWARRPIATARPLTSAVMQVAHTVAFPRKRTCAVQLQMSAMGQ
jgi:hypothetical protein